MKMLVVSDTHRFTDRTEEIYRSLEGIDLLVHLGDHRADAEKIGSDLGVPFIAVRGNCDGAMIFDMRFIPNPFYVPSLKRLTGNSKKIRNYVMKFQESQTFVKNLNRLINAIIPCYMREGKYNLNIAFGCTGGQHRSVAMANEMYDLFTLQGKQVTIEHRDANKR